MMNFIFSGMLIFSFVFAVLTGRVDQLSQSVLKQAGNAVELVLSLLGMLCLGRNHADCAGVKID